MIDLAGKQVVALVASLALALWWILASIQGTGGEREFDQQKD